MLNFTRIKRLSSRLFSGEKDYKERADKQWVLSYKESSVSPPAIYLPGELAKVTGVAEQTTFQNEVRRVEGGTTEHAATTAYRLRNVEICRGYAYEGPVKIPLTTAKESWLNSDKSEHFHEAALACSLYGNRYFGHWMADDLALNLAARELAMTVRTSQELTPNQVEYSNLLEISATPVERAFFDQLIVIEDYSQNNSKRTRYQQIRAKMRSRYPDSSSAGVMLLRGKSGIQRFLVNEDEVARFFADLGFTIIDPEITSAKEIVRKSLGAKIVVGVEGSQLANGLFTVADKGLALVLQPPYRFNNVYKERLECLGVGYSFVVGKQVEGGFRLCLDDLARTMDLIHSKLQ